MRTSLTIRRAYSRIFSAGGSAVFRKTGVTSNDNVTASSALTRRGRVTEPNIGAVDTSALVRASTSVNTMKRLTRNVSNTENMSPQRQQGISLYSLAGAAGLEGVRNVRDQFVGVFDEPRQQPWQREA